MPLVRNHHLMAINALHVRCPEPACTRVLPPPRKCQSGANHGKWFTARLCKTCCRAQSDVFCRIHEPLLPPTVATAARQLAATRRSPAVPRRRRESIPFPAPGPRDKELPHECLARQQEAAARLAALTPLPPSPTLSQEARDKALAVSLALGTSPPPSVSTAEKSIIIMQQNSAHFEEGIARMTTSISTTHTTLTSHMSSLAPDREWLAFSGRSDHLLNPKTPLRNLSTIVYPSRDDPSVTPVHSGLLERKWPYTRAYREHFYVLTPAGFLHEYALSDPLVPGACEPLFSLFLPMCTLGPSSGAGARSHKFHIEGCTDGSGMKGGSMRRSLGRLRGGEHAWR